jgi:hypothetical protein
VVKEGGSIALLSQRVMVVHFVGAHVGDGTDPVEASNIDKEDDLVECKRVSSRDPPVPLMGRREFRDSLLSDVSDL